jgi:transcriptional regulator with XRE-family HTH domain
MAKGRTRRKKVPSSLRIVIAENVRRRAEQVFIGATNMPVAIRMATADADSERMAKSNIQKVIAGKTSITLEQLDALARALDLSPYQLLIPSLDAKNPQLAKGATQDEQELYRRIAKEAVKEALQQTVPPYKTSKHK